MFVRVITQTGQTLYHCDEFQIDSDGDESEDTVHLQMKKAGKTPMTTKWRVVDKREESVYVMNEDGQTIDAYPWGGYKGD